MSRKVTVLYGSGDIARHYNVNPSAVTNWINRGSGPIPPPEYVTVSGLVYWSERTFKSLPPYEASRGMRQTRLRRFNELTGRGES